MKKLTHSESEIVKSVNELEAGVSADEICRRLNVSRANKCGMSLRAGGFAYLTESRNENIDVSFWTNESDGSDYFYILYVCYNYMNVSSLGHSIETMKYYIRCIKE